jgi:hypothetical protein
MKYESKDVFEDVPLKFENGVAAIDVVALKGAANAFEEYISSVEVLLPPSAEYRDESIFEDLMKITVDPNGPSVTAFIDTKKMIWKPEFKPERTVLVDYNGTQKRAVSFAGGLVVSSEGTNITRLPVELEDGSIAVMWFAEVTEETLSKVQTYELFSLAKKLIGAFQEGTNEKCSKLTVPAQQIDYSRSMGEVKKMNPSIDSILQIFKVALDETGARVFVETKMSRFGIPASKVAVFGSNGPVLFWLTGIDETKELTPFAVVATTSEAWLDPEKEIDFTLGM